MAILPEKMKALLAGLKSIGVNVKEDASVEEVIDATEQHAEKVNAEKKGEGGEEVKEAKILSDDTTITESVKEPTAEGEGGAEVKEGEGGAEGNPAPEVKGGSEQGDYMTAAQGAVLLEAVTSLTQVVSSLKGDNAKVVNQLNTNTTRLTSVIKAVNKGKAQSSAIAFDTTGIEGGETVMDVDDKNHGEGSKVVKLPEAASNKLIGWANK